jgi:hypothetical protein
MTPLDLFFMPAVLSLVVLVTLLREYPRRPRPRTQADERAMVLLQSWLTPEQDKQWAMRGEFEVIGCNTGARYRITNRAVMNVHQLDLAGRTVAQWCFAPKGGLAAGDILLAQKIALETMEREALALANSQAVRL